jgi:Domain of unknown function (DUF4386)
MAGDDRAAIRKTARVAGALYLSLVPLGIISFVYVPSLVFVPGNTAATASNILASEWVFRLGTARQRRSRSRSRSAARRTSHAAFQHATEWSLSRAGVLGAVDDSAGDADLHVRLSAQMAVGAGARRFGWLHLESASNRSIDSTISRSA